METTHLDLGTDPITIFPPEQSFFIVILGKRQGWHCCRAPVLLVLPLERSDFPNANLSLCVCVVPRQSPGCVKTNTKTCQKLL